MVNLSLKKKREQFRWNNYGFTEIKLIILKKKEKILLHDSRFYKIVFLKTHHSKKNLEINVSLKTNVGKLIQKTEKKLDEPVKVLLKKQLW